METTQDLMESRLDIKSRIAYIDLMKLKNNIKLGRVKAEDITQQQLADKVSCSRQTINSIEKGKFNPSIELVLKISKALNLRVEEIFYLEQEEL